MGTIIGSQDNHNPVCLGTTRIRITHCQIGWDCGYEPHSEMDYQVSHRGIVCIPRIVRAIDYVAALEFFEFGVDAEAEFTMVCSY